MIHVLKEILLVLVILVMLIITVLIGILVRLNSMKITLLMITTVVTLMPT
jgi:hypothetical protein